MCADAARLKVVLCWHMHQPQYGDLISGEYHLPWVYLHCIKDYTDMAAHLEDVPGARAVVNFSPVLLDQIADYARQVHGYLDNNLAIRDPLLSALANPALPVEVELRTALMHYCLRANQQHMISRFKPFQRLVDIAESFGKQHTVMEYVQDQFLVDLLVWYHLAWMGESVRRQDKRIKRLMEKARDYTMHDRLELLSVIDDLLSGVVGRYARLAEGGKVELSVSPLSHPILPLLIDVQCAREAMPDALLPHGSQYPGGEERVRWQLEEAISSFQSHFGRAPNGCWPSEGGLSTATIGRIDSLGFRWCASGEGVFRHSIAARDGPVGQFKGQGLYQPYRVAGSNLACFFRDDRLSDQIGFVYSDWHADDAVANLLHHLENIADAFADKQDSVVSLILDGENAWEYYPENGYYFLSTLYQKLSEHPRLELTTFSDYLDAADSINQLDHLVAGSWVYGTFSTWIGEKDKNRGWEMLDDAKRAFDSAVAAGLTDEHRQVAERLLAICEGSDWFWWFGEDNPTETVNDFDQLYRRHLSRLYKCIKQEPPEYLAHSFSHGGGTPLHGGTMRPGKAS